MTTAWKLSLKSDGTHPATLEDVEAAGGRWDDRCEAWVFADGSAGRFIDRGIRRGARTQYRNGDGVLVFEVAND